MISFSVLVTGLCCAAAAALAARMSKRAQRRAVPVPASRTPRRRR